jgi:hypothetical protein
VSLLWAVPVVAVAVAAALVLARVRTLEQACTALVVEVRRSSELRVPLAEVRRQLRRSGPLVDRVWNHWETGENPSEPGR